MESAELMEGNWASYQPPKIKSHYQWSDFFENGRIIIRIDKNVMKSDQAILGIIAHELYELNAIRNKIGTNSIPAAALQRFINDVHSAAIDLQNRAVQQL
ncbi:hypothetical protein [Prosthecobacter fusiformis]|nr:hypothetical protein [Prosthecobacter fusiformis]